jgi:hypothetical protein
LRRPSGECGIDATQLPYSHYTLAGIRGRERV